MDRDARQKGSKERQEIGTQAHRKSRGAEDGDSARERSGSLTAAHGQVARVMMTSLVPSHILHTDY
jgi:hypothetical protein